MYKPNTIYIWTDVDKLITVFAAIFHTVKARRIYFYQESVNNAHQNRHKKP